MAAGDFHRWAKGQLGDDFYRYYLSGMYGTFDPFEHPFNRTFRGRPDRNTRHSWDDDPFARDVRPDVDAERARREREAIEAHVVVREERQEGGALLQLGSGVVGEVSGDGRA